MQEPDSTLDTSLLLQDSLFGIQALLAWVDAVPDDTHLLAMPGVDRDWLNELASKLDQAVKAPTPADCSWTKSSDEVMPNTYFGSCGVAWTFTEGGPSENDMRFCPKCGGSLNEHARADHAAVRPTPESAKAMENSAPGLYALKVEMAGAV